MTLFLSRLTDSYVYRYEDQVVQDNFKFGDDKEIVSLGPNSAIHVKIVIMITRALTLSDRSWLCRIMF